MQLSENFTVRCDVWKICALVSSIINAVYSFSVIRSQIPKVNRPIPETIQVKGLNVD